MNLTPVFKSWLIENCDVSKDATDDEFRKAAGDALVKGTLSPAKMIELSKEPESKEANDLIGEVRALNTNISKLVAAGQEKKAEEGSTATATATAGTKEPETKKVETKEKEPETKKPEKVTWLSKMITRMGDDGSTLMGDDGARVKGPHERYDDTKMSLTYPSTTKSGSPHPSAGRPVLDFNERGRVMQTSSELDMAISGAFAKFLVSCSQRGGSRNFGFQALPQHDKELLCYAMENCLWSGSSDGSDFADIRSRKLVDLEQKQLIDDAASGGLEAAPIIFDDQIIQRPLLHGELFPLVNVVPLDRGRRVEGVASGTVTGTWGGVDDTAIPLLNTAGYITAFDTTIFRWEGSIRIGLDFLGDTPIDFGQHITAQYGERLLEDLDDVIAVGNGTTQPEGIINHAGVTTVAFGAATNLGNYETLRFGVAKNEHRANVAGSAVFCGTETSYQRARAIPVGAADARRLGGMDYSSYQWMERPYKINESLTNAQIFYAILARYRMYRRRGLTIRTSTEGDTLIRRNELLIVAMSRYGGQLERGATAAITTTAPV